jgi:outer membrane lipoprotein-sorting protein
VSSELSGTASGLSHAAQASETKDGAGTVDKWLSSAQALQDYSFNFSMTVFKKSGQVTEAGLLFFKEPRLLRIEIKKGPKAGSVAVLQSDGKVRGHMGGALKLFSATLSPDSSMLKSENGWPMVKSDYVSLAEAVESYIRQDKCVAKVSDSPATVDGHADVYDWTLNHADGTLFKRALFNAQTGQPVEWWDYVDGKLFAHSVWTDFKYNQALTDKQFTLKGDM